MTSWSIEVILPKVSYLDGIADMTAEIAIEDCKENVSLHELKYCHGLPWTKTFLLILY